MPVAAFPVTGPIDLVRVGETGFPDHNLAAAAMRALSLDRAKARAYALNFSWTNAAEQFLASLTTAHETALTRARLSAVSARPMPTQQLAAVPEPSTKEILRD